MKRFFKCFSITTVIWIVSRLIPAFISAIDPASSILRMAAFTLLLPLGWLAANAISNGKHPVCVRVNLYIFAFLEGNGIFSVLSMLMELSYSTGRYSTNVYGVDYDLYPLLIISALAFIAVYIGLCLYLAKATNRIPEKEIVKKENVPDDIPELKRWWYEDGSLFVQFQSGNIRKYIDVPKKMFNALCNASPKSKYLFEYIVGNFNSEQIVSVSQKAKSEEKERIKKQKIDEELARLHKQTTKSNVTLAAEEPELVKTVVVEKNHEKKQKLRDQIAKLKNDLNENDKSYEENRKILAEAFSDEELDQMVARGEFPADMVTEYKNQRKGLEMLIAFMPTARKDMVKYIGELTKELAELECE